MCLVRYEFHLYFYSPVVDNRGCYLAITITPEMKSIPISFYKVYNADYSITLRNKKNEELTIPVFKIKFDSFERYKYVVDISTDLIIPLLNDEYYNVVYLDIKDVEEKCVNTYRFDVFNEFFNENRTVFSSFFEFDSDNQPEYNYFYSRPPILEGLIIIIKLFTTEKIIFRVFEKLLCLTSSIIRRSVSDDYWLSTVKLLTQLSNQNEETYKTIIKLNKICCFDKEKQSYLFQSLVLTSQDAGTYKVWKNLFKSYNLEDSCIDIVRKKMEKEITEGNVEPCIEFKVNYDLELSFLTLKVPNISFRADPYYLVMLKEYL